MPAEVSAVTAIGDAAVRLHPGVEPMPLSMMDGTGHPVAVVLPSWSCAYANQSFRALVGADNAELDLNDGRLHVPPELLTHLSSRGRRCRTSSLEIADADGRHWRVSVSPVLAAGQPLTLVVAVEITQTVLALRRETRRASLDSLTGLPHRGEFDRLLGEALSRASRRDSPGLSVAFFDIDHFKEVNDTLGHHIGDQVLVTVAARLQHLLRAGDVVGRIGGDEFALLCEELPESPDDHAVSDRVAAAMRDPLMIGHRTVRLRLSSGVVRARPGETATDVLARADRAMYQAKPDGRGRTGAQPSQAASSSLDRG